MVFSSGGKSYDTNDLDRFDTADDKIPVAYLDPDSSRIFIEKRDRWKSDIIEVDLQQLRELSRQLDLKALIDELTRKAKAQLRKCAGTNPSASPQTTSAGR